MGLGVMPDVVMEATRESYGAEGDTEFGMASGEFHPNPDPNSNPNPNPNPNITRTLTLTLTLTPIWSQASSSPCNNRA